MAMSGCGVGPAEPVRPTAISSPAVAPAPPSPSPSRPPTGAPPDLAARVRPLPIQGPAPLTVTVDLCRTSDPDGDSLVYAFEWAGEGKQLTSECAAIHTYDSAVESRAFFCATDGHPEHLACASYQVSIR
jgi:hypothetical protein